MSTINKCSTGYVLIVCVCRFLFDCTTDRYSPECIKDLSGQVWIIDPISNNYDVPYYIISSNVSLGKTPNIIMLCYTLILPVDLDQTFSIGAFQMENWPLTFIAPVT